MRSGRRPSPAVLLLALLPLLACAGPLAVLPTATALPAPTETATPMPTATVTATVTSLPTATAVPLPASLSGKILLSDGRSRPFASVVKLYLADGSGEAGESQTDSGGAYRIEKIDPGWYDLWVLITTKLKMVAGCADVAPPDNTWQMGIQFGAGKSLTMEHAYLSKALLLMEMMPASSDLQAQGFYAVQAGLKLQGGTENRLDVTLICK